MTNFAIIEIDDGLTIVPVSDGQKADDAALKEGGVLVNPGPFADYEEACDALVELEKEIKDEEESSGSA